MSNKQEKQQEKEDIKESSNWKAIGINGLFLVIGAIIGVIGTLISANAQITSAIIAANAQITSVWMEVYGPIHEAQTAEARSTRLALSVTPALTVIATPEETPTMEFSSAILAVNDFFSWINNAGNKDDLIRSWNLETSGISGFKCKEAAGCDLTTFQNWWWQWKVQYKLYDCGSNIVSSSRKRNTRLKLEHLSDAP